MLERIFNVLEITLPVFAMIGLGRWLTVKNIMTADHRQFINKLIYHFSLPALMFIGIAGTSFDKLVNPPIIVGAIAPVLVIIIIAFIITKILKINPVIQGPFIYAGFWANATYMGFPLAERAFGAEGFVNAAIFNAFGVPVWLTAGTIITGLYGDVKDPTSKLLKNLAANPLLAASILGVLVAFIIQKTTVSNYVAITAPVSMITSFLKLGGSMGLPLALLAIGGGLSFKAVADDKFPLAIACSFKVVLTPLITLLLINYLFPEADKVVVGSCVLLMSMPVAIASYIIATGSHINEGAASAVVVWTTAASIITIPAWLYFLI